jgi:predicted nucleic acid-binding Zn ribbon protein
MSSKKVDLALELFRTYKTGFIKKKKTQIVEEKSQPGDPTLISDVLTHLVSHRQWESGLAEGNLFVQWEKIVGSDIATHSTPISI